MARTRWRVWIAIGCGAALIGVGLWSRTRPMTVAVAVVGRGPLRITADGEGETRVRHRYTISAPITGRLARVALTEGDSVHNGDQVARIDPGPLDPRTRAEWEASLRAAEDAEREAAARVRQARASLERSVKEGNRMRALSDTRAIATRELEAATTAEARDREELDAAESRARELAHESERIRAALGSSGTGGFVWVRSPVRGVVLRIPQRDERIVPAGEPLVEVGNARDLEIVVDVLSTDAVLIRPGAEVAVDGWGGTMPFRARVRRIDPAAFTKTSALGVDEQRVNVIIDPVDLPPELGDRYRVTAHITVWQTPAALLVPVSALVRTQGGWSTFAIRKGRAVLQPVTIGHADGRQAEVLGGITDGDVVVVRPAESLRAGQAVRAG